MNIPRIPEIMGSNLTTCSTKIVTFTGTLLCRKKGNRDGAGKEQKAPRLFTGFLQGLQTPEELLFSLEMLT